MFLFLFLAPYARTTRYEEVKNGLGRFTLSALPHYYVYTWYNILFRSLNLAFV